MNLLERAIQFAHPDKILRGFHGVERRMAEYFGVSEDAYGLARVAFVRRVEEAAGRLLADAAVREAVARLPLADGETVAAMGDSLTDDLQSWFEIVRVVVGQAWPGRPVRWVNAGVSGETTLHLVARAEEVAQVRPSRVLVLAGTNDARRHGTAGPLLSPDETRRNLGRIRDLVSRHGGVRVVWITPPGVLPERIARDVRFSRGAVTWRADDVRAVAEVVRGMEGPVVDVAAEWGEPPPAEWLSDDGVHPSLAGQERLARAVLLAWGAGISG